MFQNMFENVRRQRPLVHSITNYVTANDCANILLACGASPIMADDMEEAAEVTALCDGLNINIGTLNSRRAAAMLSAGRQTNMLNRPVVLDPVGVGVSNLRTQTALQLLKEIKFTVICANLSEIKTLASGIAAAKGVDANASDQITPENLDDLVALAKNFANATGAVIAITGSIDIVADRSKAYCIHSGHPMMSSVTGTGCQLSAMTAAFAAANPDDPLEAAAAAAAAMGYAGEIAYSRLTAMEGNATYRNYIIDAIYNMTPEMLEKGARYEIQ